MGNSTGTADTENTVLSFDADYSVAPGWDVIGNLSFIDAENISRTTTDNDGSLFILYNRFLI